MNRAFAIALVVALLPLPALHAQDASSAPASGVPAAHPSTITVDAGTVIPLTLVTPIKSKSTRVGETVRARVAFPVTVGTRLAIPEGAFVEGQLVQSTFPKGFKQPKNAPPVSPLKVHFTELIYPNGYTVSLDAALSAAILPRELAPPASGNELDAALSLPNEMKLAEPQQHGPSPAADPFAGLAFVPQQSQPVTNPYAHSGPNPAVFYGPAIAGAVVAAVIVIAAHHHGEPLDSVLYGSGYQFQMTLNAPLLLDRSRVGQSAGNSDDSQ
jgi:hypothetical protein